MSDTPETDAAWDAVSRRPDGFYDSRVPINDYAHAMLDHARKIERQRDEARKLAQDALATLRETREKYGIGDRHVMREKNREIAQLRSAIRLVLALPNHQKTPNMPHELPPHFHQIKADEARFFAEKSQREDSLDLRLKVTKLEQALKFAAIEITELRHQIRETIMENLHLADGDQCTLKRLKDAIGFDDEDEKTPPRCGEG